jgi:hypothetical protein
MMGLVGRPRATHCLRNHPFTPANVRYNGNGSQDCVVCARRRSRAWQRRHRVHLPIVDDKQGGPIALVTWQGRAMRASWTFHPSHAHAAALAPADGTPYTIVDVAQRCGTPKFNWPMTGAP